MKKLFRIRIYHEEFIAAENDENALMDFWGKHMDKQGCIEEFIDKNVTIEQIKEAKEMRRK
jgi:hypothetical protein